MGYVDSTVLPSQGGQLGHLGVGSVDSRVPPSQGGQLGVGSVDRPHILSLVISGWLEAPYEYYRL